MDSRDSPTLMPIALVRKSRRAGDITLTDEFGVDELSFLKFEMPLLRFIVKEAFVLIFDAQRALVNPGDELSEEENLQVFAVSVYQAQIKR